MKQPHRENPQAHTHLRRIGLCGWNHQAREILKQIHDPVVRQAFQVTVLSRSNAVPDGRFDAGLLHNVSFVFGDVTQRAMLDSAGVRNMETLVILADAETEEARRYVDHRSLITALAARNLSDEVRIVVEVLDPANQEHFQRIPGVEVVSVQDLAEQILAQAVITPGITGIFMDLLTASFESNEIYLVPVPERWHGKSFQDASSEQAQEKEEIVLLGYEVPNPETGASVQVVNPAREQTQRHGVEDWRRHILDPTDRLIVLAYEEPAWDDAAQPIEARIAT